jgi:hypothetical protein
MAKHETVFNANPTQRAFIESRAEADLFASRKGEGKSAGLCWSAFYFTSHNPGANLVVLRDTWENLQRTTLDEWFRWFPNGIYGEWMSSQRCWYWNKKRTGLEGKVYFFGAESKDDAQRIASMPLAGGLFDEPAPAANSSQGIDEFVFDTVMGQLRQPGMNWYIAKLATNNPDQTHWTYKRFVKPGTPPIDRPKLEMQDLGYRCWQTREAENVGNLPPGYYEAMAQRWKDRKDLLRRFVEGKFGFQSKGKAVTPEWNDDIHLASGLQPVKGLPLKLMWDGGQNPTCVMTQITPLGDWLVLDAFVGEGYGTFELIRDVVKPRLTDRYPWVRTIPRGLEHTGDPNMESPDQSSSANDAAKVIVKELGGAWFPGPITIEGRVDPLREVLRKTRDGRGLMVVDRDHAEAVWFALRGGWHYRIARNGVVGSIMKDEHSHPGDCMGYGAARWFPTGKLLTKRQTVPTRVGGYFNTAPGVKAPFIGVNSRGVIVPPEMRTIGKRELPFKL